jgi:hypothetical protein
VNKYGGALTTWSKDYYWSFNALYISLHIVLTVFLLPGEAITMMLSGFITKDLLRATLLNFFGNWLSSIIIFIVVHNF